MEGCRKMANISPGEVIMLAISFFLVAILGPMALGEIFAANTTGWTTTVKTIFQTLLPILWVIGVAIRYIPRK